MKYTETNYHASPSKIQMVCAIQVEVSRAQKNSHSGFVGLDADRPPHKKALNGVAASGT